MKSEKTLISKFQISKPPRSQNLNYPPKHSTLTLPIRPMASKGSEPGSDSDELEDLEYQVTEMAEKIQEYRTTVPEQLKNTLPSIIEAQRPILADGSEPGTSGAPVSGQIASDKDALGDQTFQKINLLRDKISSNVAELPIVMKRLKECVSRIDKLDSENIFIHPAFKQKRTG